MLAGLLYIAVCLFVCIVLIWPIASFLLTVDEYREKIKAISGVVPPMISGSDIVLGNGAFVLLLTAFEVCRTLPGVTGVWLISSGLVGFKSWRRAKSAYHKAVEAVERQEKAEQEEAARQAYLDELGKPYFVRRFEAQRESARNLKSHRPWYIPYSTLSQPRISGGVKESVYETISGLIDKKESPEAVLRKVGQLASLIATFPSPIDCCSFSHWLFEITEHRASEDDLAMAVMPLVSRFEKEIDRDLWRGSQYVRALMHAAPKPIGDLFATWLEKAALKGWQIGGMETDQRWMLNEWRDDGKDYLRRGKTSMPFLD